MSDLGQILREYIAARAAYEEAIRPSSQWSHPKQLTHGSPIALRLREARAALLDLPDKLEAFITDLENKLDDADARRRGDHQ